MVVGGGDREGDSGSSAVKRRGEKAQGLVPLRWGCALPSPNAPAENFFMNTANHAKIPYILTHVT